MSKLKQVLQWKIEGHSNREIAALTGLNKETVNNYVSKAKADPMELKELVRLEDHELDIRLRGGNAAYTDERFSAFREMLPYFVEQMSNPRNHMTIQLLWEEYRHKHPDGYSLTQFRYHYNQNTKAAAKPTTVLADSHEPGEKIYLDFAGDTLSYVDVHTGEIVKVQTFVACLPASNYCYAICVPSQRTEDFVHAVIQCLRHLGGVPRILVPDNLKAAVTKSDRYAPKIATLMEDMANHYGALVMPARARRPQDKANVEGAVKILYNRVYAPLRNKTFYSLSELNTAVAELMLQHNQKRMQEKQYTREEQFLAVEKPALLPLPEEDFEIRYRTSLKVMPNCCVKLGRDSHYYSVPYQYIGQQVELEFTRTIVKIYSHNELVTTHPYEPIPGQYTIKNEHFASNSQKWRSRSKEYYIPAASRIMDELGTLVSYIFLSDGRPEEVKYNSCDGLLHLAKTTDPVLFREACQAALDTGRYSYKFVKNIIDSKGLGLKRDEPVSAPPKNHSNIRGAEFYK